LRHGDFFCTARQGGGTNFDHDFIGVHGASQLVKEYANDTINRD
jgi:hypothetical protein